jgi:hypothetical protein
VPVQNPLGEDRETCGCECSGETEVEESLGRDDRAWRAGPVRDLGDITSENGVVVLDEEESGGFLVRVQLELRTNVNDKR